MGGIINDRATQLIDIMDKLDFGEFLSYRKVDGTTDREIFYFPVDTICRELKCGSLLKWIEMELVTIRVGDVYIKLYQIKGIKKEGGPLMVREKDRDRAEYICYIIFQESLTI